MLTEFGKKLRTLRIQRGKTLLDLGQMLGLSTAFVSAVETGRKAVPMDLPGRIATALGLQQFEAQELERAATKSVTNVSVSLDGRNDRARELAVAFARRFDSLSDDDVKTLLEKLRSTSQRGS
jgi:HTH-type transcriptional regulator, competence development regulator